MNQLLQIYSADTRMQWEPRYNIAPTQEVLAIRSRDSQREVVLLRWGLIPAWADDPKIGNRMINARSETLAEKPSFKPALRRQRCLVVADGYYEWKRQGSSKQPYYIRMQDERPFVFAGLWARWSKEEPAIESCTIITTEAQGQLADLHDRVPVILDQESAEIWLDESIEQATRLTPLLTAYPEGELTAYPVSTWVNSPAHDTPACIEPVS